MTTPNGHKQDVATCCPCHRTSCARAPTTCCAAAASRKRKNNKEKKKRKGNKRDTRESAGADRRAPPPPAFHMYMNEYESPHVHEYERQEAAAAILLGRLSPSFHIHVHVHECRRLLLSICTDHYMYGCICMYIIFMQFSINKKGSTSLYIQSLPKNKSHL